MSLISRSIIIYPYLNSLTCFVLWVVGDVWRYSSLCLSRHSFFERMFSRRLIATTALSRYSAKSERRGKSHLFRLLGVHTATTRSSMNSADVDPQKSRGRNLGLESLYKVHRMAGSLGTDQQTLDLNDVKYSDKYQKLEEQSSYSSRELVKELLLNDHDGVFAILFNCMKSKHTARLQPEIYTNILKLCASDTVRLGISRERFKRIYSSIARDTWYELDTRDIFNLISIDSMIQFPRNFYSVFLNAIESSSEIRKEAMIYKATMAGLLSIDDPHKALYVWELMNKNVYGCKADIDALSLFFKATTRISGIRNSHEIILSYEENTPLHKRSRIIYDALISTLNADDKHLQDAKTMLHRLQRRMPYIHNLSFCGIRARKPSEQETEYALSLSTFSPCTAAQGLSRSELQTPSVSWYTEAEEVKYEGKGPRDLLGAFVGVESYMALASAYLSQNMINAAYDLMMDVHTRLYKRGTNITLSVGYHSMLVSLALERENYEFIMSQVSDRGLYIKDDLNFKVYVNIAKRLKCGKIMKHEEETVRNILRLLEVSSGLKSHNFVESKAIIEDCGANQSNNGEKEPLRRQYPRGRRSYAVSVKLNTHPRADNDIFSKSRGKESRKDHKKSKGLDRTSYSRGQDALMFPP